MANGDPILVACAESNVRMVDLPLAHLIGPVVYLDPPLAAVRSAQVPLVTGVYTFCLCRLKTAAHRIEPLLRRRLYAVSQGNGCSGAHVHRDSANVSSAEPHCSIRLKRKAAPRNVITAPARRITRSLI